MAVRPPDEERGAERLTGETSRGCARQWLCVRPHIPTPSLRLQPKDILSELGQRWQKLTDEEKEVCRVWPEWEGQGRVQTLGYREHQRGRSQQRGVTCG
jgi:hypothetical protein